MLPHSILLSLLRKSSHTVPLILYTYYDFTLSSVKVFTLDFLFFSLLTKWRKLSWLSCVSHTTLMLVTDSITRGCIYTNIYLNLVTKRQDHNRIESKQQGKRYLSIYGKKIFSRVLYSWHFGTCGTVPMDEITTVFHRWVSGEADDEVANSKLHEDVKSRGE